VSVGSASSLTARSDGVGDVGEFFGDGPESSLQDGSRPVNAARVVFVGDEAVPEGGIGGVNVEDGVDQMCVIPISLSQRSFAPLLECLGGEPTHPAGHRDGQLVPGGGPARKRGRQYPCPKPIKLHIVVCVAYRLNS
jgi:hypothetical protein